MSEQQSNAPDTSVARPTVKTESSQTVDKALQKLSTAVSHWMPRGQVGIFPPNVPGKESPGGIVAMNLAEGTGKKHFVLTYSQAQGVTGTYDNAYIEWLDENKGRAGRLSVWTDGKIHDWQEALLDSQGVSDARTILTKTGSILEYLHQREDFEDEHGTAEANHFEHRELDSENPITPVEIDALSQGILEAIPDDILTQTRMKYMRSEGTILPEVVESNSFQ